MHDRVLANCGTLFAPGSRRGFHVFIESRSRLAVKSNMLFQTGVSSSSLIVLFVCYGTFDCLRNYLHDAAKVFSYFRFQFKWSCVSAIVLSLSSAQ